MKKVYTCSLLTLFIVGARSFDQFPQAEITNNIIHARFYLPDTTTGYY